MAYEDVTWLCKGMYKHVYIMILTVIIIDNAYFAFFSFHNNIWSTKLRDLSFLTITHIVIHQKLNERGYRNY